MPFWTDRTQAASAQNTPPTQLTSDQQRAVRALTQELGDWAQTWRRAQGEQLSDSAVDAEGHRQLWTKPDNTPVTWADIHISKSLKEALNGTHELRQLAQASGGDMPGITPDIPVISEENPREMNEVILQHAREKAEKEGRDGPTYWSIDPIDGTSSFVDGGKEWGVFVGLVENGKPTIGVVYYPDQGKIFYSESDERNNCLRAMSNDSSNRRKPLRLQEATGKLVLSENAERMAEQGSVEIKMRSRVEPQNGRPRGSLVLSGAADVHAYLPQKDHPELGCNEWDIAAVNAVVSAAGGIMWPIGKDGKSQTTWPTGKDGKPRNIPHCYGEQDHMFVPPMWVGHPKTLQRAGIIPRELDMQRGDQQICR